MTLLNSHHGRLHPSAATNRSTFTRFIKRAGTALRRLHRAIAAAKIRRIRRELRLHSRAYGDWTRQRDHQGSPEKDGRKFPQHPLILGEKWDY
jgi:hypothetical protein